ANQFFFGLVCYMITLSATKFFSSQRRPMSIVQPFIVKRSPGKRRPILISSPHSGTELFDEMNLRMREEPRTQLPDTDWLIDELYEFATQMGITIVKARYSRYVIDLNRDPVGQSLYED